MNWKKRFDIRNIKPGSIVWVDRKHGSKTEFQTSYYKRYKENGAAIDGRGVRLFINAVNHISPIDDYIMSELLLWTSFQKGSYNGDYYDFDDVYKVE